MSSPPSSWQITVLQAGTVPEARPEVKSRLHELTHSLAFRDSADREPGSHDFSTLMGQEGFGSMSFVFHIEEVVFARDQWRVQNTVLEPSRGWRRDTRHCTPPPLGPELANEREWTW